MRSSGAFILSVAIALVLLLGCTDTKSETPAASAWSISWSFENAGGTSALNKSTSQEGAYPAFASFNSSLYVAWMESNGSKNQVRVKATADGTTWSFVDGGGTNGLNIDPTLDANAPAILATDSRIYLAWAEDNGSSTPQIRVKESANGTTWTSIESGGINFSSSYTAASVKLVYFSNKLYAIWEEFNAVSDTMIRVKRYDGGTTWTSVGGGALNHSTNYAATDAFAAVYNDKLYITWAEIHPSYNTTQIRVKATTDGTTWSFVDGGATEGLNKDPEDQAGTPKFAVFDSKLFLTFNEHNGSTTQVRVKHYDGTSWTSVDGNGTTGINVSTAQSAGGQSLVVFNSRLLAIWSEGNGTASQIRAKVYGGGSTWSTADGGGTTGLNSVATQHSYYPWVHVFASKLYVAWHEYFTSNYRIMVKAGS